MKKIACLFVCCCILSFGTLSAFAKESTVRTPKNQIPLTQTQTKFEAVIEVEPENAYAGVEVGIACPENVSVTDSSASLGSMSAKPVLSGGLYWTGFFESDNQLSGTMKITLHLSCSESFKSGDIQLQKVKVLTKNGVAVDTEEISPAIKIGIIRNASGAIESGPDIDAPSGNDVNSTDSGADVGGENISQTGENSHIVMNVILILASGCIVFGIIFLVFRKKKHD